MQFIGFSFTLVRKSEFSHFYPLTHFSVYRLLYFQGED
jgi:hypothetical protein